MIFEFLFINNFFLNLISNCNITLSNFVNMKFFNERFRFFFNTMNEKNKFRFKKNIRDFLNNLNKQFNEQKKINKKLKNVLINYKFKFKFKLRFNKINNNNKKITYMKLKNNT